MGIIFISIISSLISLTLHLPLILIPSIPQYCPVNLKFQTWIFIILSGKFLINSLVFFGYIMKVKGWSYMYQMIIIIGIVDVIFHLFLQFWGIILFHEWHESDLCHNYLINYIVWMTFGYGSFIIYCGILM